MKKFFDYLGKFGAMLLAFGLYSVVQMYYFYPQKVQIPMKALVIAVCTFFDIGLIIWMYRRQLKKQNEWGFDQEPHWQLKRIGIAVLGFFLIVILGALTAQLIGAGNGTSANQAALEKISKQSGRMFPILVVFLGPICEETIFRGMFFNTFFRRPTKLNKVLGIIASGFVFAFLHDPTLSKYIFIYWVLGIVLAWVYVTTRDLRYSILVHMCYNALGFI